MKLLVKVIAVSIGATILTILTVWGLILWVVTDAIVR